MAVDQRIVWGGVAVGGAGIAIYMYRRNKKQQAATAAATDTSGDGTGDGTGLDQLQYDPAGEGFGPYGLGSYGDSSGYSGAYDQGYYGAGTVPVGVPQTASTNAQWSEAAMSALSAAGYEPQTVLAALGVYLTGGNLAQDQATIVTAAIGAEGYPPVAGPGGYPPSMHVGGTPGGGQGGTGDGGGTTAVKAGAISNLQAYSVQKTSFTVRWNAARGATGYHFVVSQMNGHVVSQGTKSGTTLSASGLHPGWTYNVAIQGLPGGPGNNIHVTTKR